MGRTSLSCYYDMAESCGGDAKLTFQKMPSDRHLHDSDMSDDIWNSYHFAYKAVNPMHYSIYCSRIINKIIIWIHRWFWGTL